MQSCDLRVSHCGVHLLGKLTYLLIRKGSSEAVHCGCVHEHMILLVACRAAAPSVYRSTPRQLLSEYIHCNNRNNSDIYNWYSTIRRHKIETWKLNPKLVLRHLAWLYQLLHGLRTGRQALHSHKTDGRQFCSSDNAKHATDNPKAIAIKLLASSA